MQREPIIFLISPAPALEETLRPRYKEGYRIVTNPREHDPLDSLYGYREQGEQIALFVYEQAAASTLGFSFLRHSSAIYPNARKLLLAMTPETVTGNINQDGVDAYIVTPWEPAETKLFPVLDELLADWRTSLEMPFMRVKGIMTVRAVRIRTEDTLHRAAEIIALSGVGDLMVIDADNNFVGVLSVGDVLRAAMPDVEEIMEEGGTLDQAFRLFLRKGGELMYKPIAPLIITNPLVVDPDDHVAKAVTLMLDKNIHRLPVVKDGRLVGTVGRADVCQAVVGTL